MSEVLAPEAFIRDLDARIHARRTFGGHPLWHEIADGKLGPEQLKLFAVQFFLQVREFPRAVSAMHANCPFPEERMELAENVYEEETGRISGCNQPHPELFIRFGEALGLARDLTEALDTEQQLWLLQWWQLHLWRQAGQRPVQQRLNVLRRHLLGHVQPRLAWEVALLDLMGP